MGVEEAFDTGFAAALALREKQIQQSCAPFVFTYHHNDAAAYAPLVIAMLNAGMDCTAVLPAVAEMSASLHIHGTSSSVLDSVFVCRRDGERRQGGDVASLLRLDVETLRAAGMRLTRGDVRCLAAGHIARVAVNRLRADWEPTMSRTAQMSRVEGCLVKLSGEYRVDQLVSSERKRKQDMRDLLLATEGKVFTLNTLDQLIPNTRLREFVPMPPSTSPRCRIEC